MTIEEFLSLPDVKDGIATPNRIEGLLALMQKELDGVEKSAGEATRQHSAIARAITETKDTNCLDHFIKLGGLCYINGWLSDALKSVDDTNGDIIEDSVTLHFKALEKLGINNEMLISSGILDTVKNLCDHKNTIIKEQARELLDSWKDVDLPLLAKNVGKADTVGVNEEDKSLPKSDEDGSLLQVIDVGTEQAETSPNITVTGKEGGSDCLQFVEAVHIQAEATCDQISAPASLDQINLDEKVTGSVISSDAASISIPEAVTPGEGIINIGNSISLHPRDIDNIGGGNPGAHETTNNGKDNEKINSASADLKITEAIQSTTPQKSDGCSAPDILMAEQTVPEPGTQINIDYKESLVPMRGDSVDDGKEVHSENSSEMKDLGHQRSSMRESPDRTSPTHGALPEKTSPDIVVGLNSEDYSKVSAIQNLARDTKSSTVAETRSDIDMDYGIMDALEVARQVAKAVEMDMVNNGSDENISDASRQPSGPDSTNEVDSQSRNLSEESSSKVDSSPELSTENKIESSCSEKIGSEDCVQGVDQPQSLVQEVQVNTNKETFEFDLNQEVPFENVEFSVNLDQNMDEANGVLPIQNSSPIPEYVASGSRSHVDVPQHVRSHGWRGSVGINASHHKDADPYGLSSISGQQKQGAFSIDLNLDKEGNDSNDAAGPLKSKEFEFDLNMVSDVDDDQPSSSWRLDQQNTSSHLNGHLRSSPSSSLFRMQHTQNFDLNEGPSMHSISSRPQPFIAQNVDIHPFFGVSSSQNISVLHEAKPVISLMGARVEVNGNDYLHGAPSLSNGKSENSAESNTGAMGSYLGIGPTVSYGHPSHFAYNTNVGQTMTFGSPMFRPGNTMTYMVDPRVGPLPQMVNSTSVVPHMYAQSPFFLSMAGPPPGLNGVSPSRPNFDLNLGIMNEGGNRQDMASRQLFLNNQGRFIGDHLNPPDSQPSSSFGKRKESEPGWETYPYNMKHRYPGNR